MLPSDLTWALATGSQLAATGGSVAGKAFSERCLALKPQLLIQSSLLTKLEVVTKGSTIDLSDNVESCNRRSQKVEADLCRVGLQIPTSRRSSISFEVWLPEKWDGGRYLGTGNGGVDGC
jgi:feruloyl esterase